MDESTTPSCGSCGSRWKLLLLLVAVLLFVASVSRNRLARETTHADEQPPAGQTVLEQGQTITLTIDLGSRRERNTLPWREGMTVRDALVAASDSTGGVKFTQQGEGAAAFLTAIDGMRNEGAGGRNWTYAVNDTPGDRSFEIYALKSGDEVLWSFAGEK